MFKGVTLNILVIKTDIYKNYTLYLLNNVLYVSFEILNPREKIGGGIFISNHNSGFDNMYDSYIQTQRF